MKNSESIVYYVGEGQEVAHHAKPLRGRLNIQICSPKDLLDRARPGDLAIFYSEHFRRFRELIPKLRERNVGTLYAIDGILEWRNAWENRPDEPASPFTMRPVLSDKVACIGAAQSRVLASWGNAAKVETVGIPRLDQLADRVPRQSSNELRVLVMSAKWPGFTDEQVERAVNAFRDLRDWFDDNPTCDGRQVTPVWRLTQGIDEQLEINNQLTDLTGQDLASTLVQVDAVITMPSTAMLEGMLQGIPVALLDYNSCPHYVPAAWEIFSRDQMAEIIPKLLHPASDRLAYQQSILAHNLAGSGHDESATDRMVNLIAAMQREMQVATREGRSFAFSSGSDSSVGRSAIASNGETVPSDVFTEQLDLPNESASEFDHAAIYPEFGEFGKEDLTTLQIELVDARREIEQRDAEILQLKKELGQAHEIFEQIHSHPIAGPVVRLRQRVRDWLASRKDSNNASDVGASSHSNLGGSR